MHRSSGLADTATGATHSVSWDGIQSTEDWLKTQPVHTWIESFDRDGYLKVENLLLPDELENYKDLYDKMLSGKIDATNHRHDLGNQDPQKVEGKENICQIMWPSLYVNGLNKGPLHERTAAIAQKIIGKESAFDFDMLIAKSPGTDTITPWHQDESYWLDLADKRAASFWVAMDDADVDNGCMWFVKGSHKKPLRKHKPAKPGVHVLTCEGTEEEGSPMPLKAGSCTIHSGQTMHYTRGNSTDRERRAYITNYRPAAMVEYERQNNYDHGKAGISKEELGIKGQGHQGTS